MFCKNCGKSVDDGLAVCSNCGTSVSGVSPSTQTSSSKVIMTLKRERLLVGSIFVNICCCPIGGAVAIVYAAMASFKRSIGDTEGAKQAEGKAKIWLLVSLAVGFVAWFIQMAWGIYEHFNQ
jgi:uncharacterized membrane protein YvbJ